MNLGVSVGDGCRRLHDAMMRDLQVAAIELDEQWGFLAKKNRRVRPDDPPEYGDVWLFTAIAATQKAIISYVVGKRTAQNTQLLANDLRARVVNRPQITADGYLPYPNAIDGAFGIDVDFAVLTKQYATTPGNEAAVRYSPGRIRGVDRTVMRGSPDPERISTSYIKRFDLTTRMACRRLTHLTNAFSRKLENHKAALALHIAYHNLCRIHETIRTTPAMELGVTDHIWTVGELIEQALSAPAANPPAVPPTTIRPGHRPVQLRVIPGGRMTNARR